jgi:hypothetical protein
MGYDIKGTVSIPAEAWVEFANKFAPSQSAPNVYMNPRIQGGELVFDYQACTEGVQEAEPKPIKVRVNDLAMKVRCELATIANRIQSFLESMDGSDDYVRGDYKREDELLKLLSGSDPWLTMDELNDIVCFAWEKTSIPGHACNNVLIAYGYTPS